MFTHYIISFYDDRKSRNLTLIASKINSVV